MAVRFDDWCLSAISNCTWTHDIPDSYTDRPSLVISNHRSWADVFVLQSAIAKTGPIIKFIAKKQLMYIPLLAVIILALRFPVVERSSSRKESDQARRHRDFERIRSACKDVDLTQGTILIFPEGTRGSPSKIQSSSSSFNRLLAPKVGGFSLLVEALQDFEPVIYDCSFFYPIEFNFWQFLGGAVDDIHLQIQEVHWRKDIVEHPAEWLMARWHQKDQLLAQDLRSR